MKFENSGNKYFQEMLMHCYDCLNEAWSQLDSAKVDFIDLHGRAYSPESDKIFEMQKQISNLKEELIEHMEMEDETEMEKELQESIRRAREVGVPEECILKTDEDLERYFTE